MKFQHYEFDAGPGNVIRVVPDGQASVRLLDSINFQRYHSGQRHQCYGGLARQSPVD